MRTAPPTRPEVLRTSGCPNRSFAARPTAQAHSDPYRGHAELTAMTLTISDNPLDGPLGVVRTAYSQDGEWIPHPTCEEVEGGLGVPRRASMVASSRRMGGSVSGRRSRPCRPRGRCEWGFGADITACFDEIDHSASMGTCRRRSCGPGPHRRGLRTQDDRRTQGGRRFHLPRRTDPPMTLLLCSYCSWSPGRWHRSPCARSRSRGSSCSRSAPSAFPSRACWLLRAFVTLPATLLPDRRGVYNGLCGEGIYLYNSRAR